MKKKAQILIFTRYYLPAKKAGGPVVSIENIIESLHQQFNFYVITGDRDANDRAAFTEITYSTWNTVGKAKVMYISLNKFSFLKIFTIMRNTSYDLVYLNSFWDPLFTTLPLLFRRLGLTPSRKMLLAPRGEFSAGAFRLKILKKKCFILFSRFFRLHKNVHWHVSNSFEARDLSNILGEAKMVHIAENIPTRLTKNISDYHPRSKHSPLRICFLSRICQKKNLHFAISTLKEIKKPVTFTVFGPIEDEIYWKQCVEQSRQFPTNVEFLYGGTVQPGKSVSIISKSDLFFLPTLGENYGHVIIESLSSGTPVLISDQTPWRHLEESGVGWDLSLDHVNSFLSVINSMTLESLTTTLKRRKRCRKFALSVLRSQKTLADNVNMFRSVISSKF